MIISLQNPPNNLDIPIMTNPGSMAFMVWTDALSVNIKEIDDQHKKLVGMVNQLHTAMLKGEGRTVIGPILAELTAYTVYHFKTEEGYMEKFAYPNLQTHRLEHQRFVQKVGDFKSSYDAGSIALSNEVMHFLADWLKDHILVTDKKFGPFFNSKGLH
jgi:hemerythrin